MSYPVFYVPAGDVLPVMFTSYAGSTGASITLTGLAVTDIEIYKDGSTTQRASDAGYTLLDTDGIDFDGITGLHGFSIDTGDNTDAGFYTVGAWFTVVVSAVTVDSQTVSFIACQFRLMPAESIAGKPKVDVDAWLGTAAATPSVAGVPEVDITHVAGATTNVSALATNVNAIKTKTDYLPSATAGTARGVVIAGVNAQTTFSGSDFGLKAVATGIGGAAFYCDGQGTNGIGFFTSGDINGYSNVGNFDIAGTITTGGGLSGNITGNLSGSVGSIAVGGLDDGAFTADALLAIADSILDRNMATGTDSGAPTVRTVRQALRVLRNRVNIATGTATIYKEDDTTSSWTAAVSTTAGDPISQVDPAGP